MAMRLNSNAKLTFNQVIAPSDPADVVEHSNVSSFGDKNWCEQYCNTISDQGECAGGWSFASIAAIESLYAIKNGGQLYNLTAQECIDCKSDGCTGNRTASNCLDYIQNHGIATNETYPYTGTPGSCQTKKDKTPIEITNILSVPANNETEIITALNNGPVIASVDASQSVFINYSTGILNALTCKKNDNNHWILIVGYGTDTTNSVDYYVIRNSWGNRWGLVG